MLEASGNCGAFTIPAGQERTPGPLFAIHNIDLIGKDEKMVNAEAFGHFQAFSPGMKRDFIISGISQGAHGFVNCRVYLRSITFAFRGNISHGRHPPTPIVEVGDA